MKLLLVNPNFKGVVLVPSLGLGFIGTHVRNHSDWDVEIVEPILQRLSERRVLKKSTSSDIIGLTCYTESRFECFSFGEKVKQTNPTCRLIVGGPHVNTLDEQILRYYPFIDAIVRGEGEETVLEMVKGRPFEEILGITWSNNGRVVRNPDRPIARDIDRFHYDYSLILPQVKGWRDLEIPRELQELKALPIIASRGCPFRCVFCAAHRQWGKVYRGLTSEELVNRLEHLVNQYKIGYFRFYDALFIGNEESILTFCDLLEKRKLNIRFRIDIRVGTRRNVLQRLREVGCDVVGFGVESGSDRVLKRINKGINRKQIDETIKICKELGYWVIGFFMISLPDETMEDVEKSFELFKFFDVINLQFFKIHPNTSFYDELKEKGEISDQIWLDSGQRLDTGFNTMYGNEVYYCKDVLPSAQFCRDEVDSLIDHTLNNYILSRPQKVVQRYGLCRGMLILSVSAMNSILLKAKMSAKLHRGLKDTRIVKLFSKRLLKVS